MKKRDMLILFAVFSSFLLFSSVVNAEIYTIDTFFKITEKVEVHEKDKIKKMEIFLPFVELNSSVSIINVSVGKVGRNETGILWIIEGKDIKRLNEGINDLELYVRVKQNMIFPFIKKEWEGKGNGDSEHIHIEDVKKICEKLKNESKSTREYVGKSVEWVKKNIKYDISFANKNYDTKEIIKIKRGVCAEFSTILIALLRCNNIPALYVSSYIYDKEKNQPVPHAFVIAKYDGKWRGIDVLWGEIGIIDGGHVVRGISTDNQIETKFTCSYYGGGECKYMGENIQMYVKKVEKREIQKIENKTLKIESGKKENITLNVNKECVYFKIFPCKGGNTIIFPKEGVVCEKEGKNISIEIKDNDVICPITVQYLDKYALINVETYTKEEYWIEKIVSYVRNFFHWITSLISKE